MPLPSTDAHEKEMRIEARATPEQKKPIARAAKGIWDKTVR
jgi:uncharacterized protein (DUF1778 family)